MDSVWGKPNSSPVRDVLSLVQPSLVKFIIIIIIIFTIIIIRSCHLRWHRLDSQQFEKS